jgi:AraC-like DNA-binding protein
MSYRQILQQTRYDLARRQLRGGGTNITDLALQLGYAEVAVFSRHFKRWSGMSPRAWQNSQTRSLRL